jgi:hypothetical protein
MDIRRVLLQQHSKANADKIADYVGSNRPRFKQLVMVYLAGPYKITQRAAWPLSICVERYPHLVVPHLRTLLSHLATSGIHDAVKRNTLRLLQFVEIPVRFHGKVIDICFHYLQANQEPVAVKVFAMTVLSRLVKNLPELKKELRLIIEDQLPYASAGFISRARKVMKAIDAPTEQRAAKTARRFEFR